MNADKERVTVVGGCGHVGLPLGIVLAEAGYQTFLYDLNAHLVEQVNAHQMPHMEEDAPERLKAVIEAKSMLATTDPSVIADSSIVILTIGTPVDEYLNPRTGDLENALRALSPYLKMPGQLIVFRSTLAPGVLGSLADTLEDQGCKPSIAYCPERIVQGKALTELKGLPQLVSGLTPEAVERSKVLFQKLTEAEPIVLEPIEAELAKLFCNAWRYISFAISNQFYQVAEKSGASFARIHEAVTSQYPRMQGFSRAGLTAGPCLLKDTLQLAAFSQNTFFLGHSAMLVNEGLPVVLVDQLSERLGGSVRRRRIGLLGLAFKADNDDTRESLSFKVRKLLCHRGAEVLCHDPYVSAEKFPHLTFGDLSEVLSCDGIIVATAHTLYRGLKIPAKTALVDVWNIVQQQEET